jgi:hypothetical protein
VPVTSAFLAGGSSPADAIDSRDMGHFASHANPNPKDSQCRRNMISGHRSLPRVAFCDRCTPADAHPSQDLARRDRAKHLIEPALPSRPPRSPGTTLRGRGNVSGAITSHTRSIASSLRSRFFQRWRYRTHSSGPCNNDEAIIEGGETGTK